MTIKSDKRWPAVPPLRQEPDGIGMPLTKVVKRRLEPGPEIVMIAQPQSLAAEKFRRLRTLIVNRHGELGRVIVVTSPSPGDGKTTVATNLALAFAGDLGERTLLVDADLRRPSLDGLLRPEPAVGLRDTLEQSLDPDHAIVSLEDSSLELLPAGRRIGDPTELLRSERARLLFAQLRQRYPRIIIDTPPIVPFTDADILGAYSDGVILVARSCETTISGYQQAVVAITSTKVLGVVLNDVTRNLADWGRYHEYDYERYYSEARNR